MKLEGKIAVVTGGTTGIGKAIAKKFLEEGAIVGIGSPFQNEVDNAVEELSAIGNVIGFNMDITNKKQVEATINTMLEKFGGVDILVNNAGITRDAQFYKMADEQWNAVINTDLNGCYYMTKAVVNNMMDRQYGKIIHISSVSAFNGNFGQSNYAAAKAGIIGMTRVQGKELGKYGINVNCIAPGSIMTDMYDSVPEDVKESKLKKIPLKRYGSPEDVANLALFLASDESSYITSQTIVIDGGFN